MTNEELLDAVVNMAWDAATKAREDDTKGAELLLEEMERLLAGALEVTPFRE